MRRSPISRAANGGEGCIGARTMMGRRVAAFVDALATGRRPKRFRADPEDARSAEHRDHVASPSRERRPLRGVRRGPFERLSTHGHRSAWQPSGLRISRAGDFLASAAAEYSWPAQLSRRRVSTIRRRPPLAAPHGSASAHGHFQASGGVILGQIVAYQGDPSWVFMNVDVPGYDGAVTCKLQVDNGSTVAFGMFAVHAGVGQFSKTIRLDISHCAAQSSLTCYRTPLASPRSREPAAHFPAGCRRVTHRRIPL